MAEEKKFADEVMSEDELDGVAGGNRLETFADGDELYKRGLLSEDDALHSAPVRKKLHQMGYNLYFSSSFVFVEGNKSQKPVSDYCETGFVYKLKFYICRISVLRLQNAFRGIFFVKNHFRAEKSVLSLKIAFKTPKPA